MEFGISYFNDDLTRFMGLPKLAEDLGYTAVWFLDSELLVMDPYCYLAYTALSTSKVKLGISVTNPVTRDPTVTATAIATVNEMSGGRAVLAIGRGDTAVRLIGEKSSTVAELEKAVSLIRKLTAGEEVEYDGKRLKLRWLSQKRLGVPVYIAAYGPMTLRLAGRMADGVWIQIADIDVVKFLLEEVRKGAKEVGRDPHEIRVIVGAPISINDDIEKAQADAAWFTMTVAGHGLEVMRRYGSSKLPSRFAADLEVLEEVKSHIPYGSHYREGVPPGLIPGEIVERFAIVGSAKKCATKIRELKDAGVHHLAVYAWLGDKEFLTRSLAENLMGASRI